MQKITSKENALIKHISKLKEKKYRNEYGEFIVEGVKLVKEAIEEKAKIKNIIVSEETTISGLVGRYLKNELEEIEYIEVTDNIFKLISDVEKPQGVLAVIEKNNKNQNIDFSQDLILALDDIQDPGNLGTIIRTADSIGLKQILVSKGTADSYNPKVIRSTMGAIFRINIIECENLLEKLEEVRKNNFEVVVTSLGTNKSVYDLKLTKSAIVIGNEANGVSKKIIEMADENVIIPMFGKTESLNASVATGVILYEYVRQKLKNRC